MDLFKYSLKLVASLSLLVFLAACDSTSNASTTIEDAGKNVVSKVAESAPGSAESMKKTISTAESVVKSKEAMINKAVENKVVAPPKVQFVEGQHYFRINPEVNTDTTEGKVEVVELLWLGCRHCYALEPTMKRYKIARPDYVDFKQVPAMLNPSWIVDGQTFYLAKLLDPSGKKHLIDKVFQAIHEQKRRLNRPQAVQRFFEQQGYSADEINKIKNSLAFKASLNRAQQIGNESQANSVPTIIVNGKYRTSPHSAGGEENLLQVIQMLTEREKNQK